MVDVVKILGSLLSSGALSSGSGSNVLGNILSSALSGGGSQSSGGMGDILGSLLGGSGQQTRPSTSSGGGMGDILGSLLGGQQGRQGGGMNGMGDVLGSLLGGGQQTRQAGGTGGGMGDLLGSLLGGGGQQGSQGGGIGDLLGGAVTKYMQSQNPGTPDVSSSFLPADTDHRQAEAQATLLIRAMINAAKADGSIDQNEQDKIVAKLGNITPDEAAFIRKEFDAPLDAAAFVSSVPRGMEQQIYTVSLMAIDLDTQKEAQYLHQLAQGFNISKETCNQLHAQAGAPKLYS